MIWKDVPGYNGKYQMDILGRLKIKDRSGNYIIAKYRLDNCGHLRTNLYDPTIKKMKTWKVHQLMAATWLGWEFHCGKDIHHLDFNKLNNRLTNIVVLSKGEHTTLHNKLRKVQRPVC